MRDTILRKVASCHSTLASVQREIISGSETGVGLRAVADHCVSVGHYHDLTLYVRELGELLEKASEKKHPVYG